MSGKKSLVARVMTSDYACIFFFQKKHFLEDPFERVEFMLYLQKTAKGSNLLKLWQQKHGHTGITKMSDYANIYGFFRKAQKTFGVSIRVILDRWREHWCHILAVFRYSTIL